MLADEIFTLRLPASVESLWASLTDAGRELSGAVRVLILRGAGADFFDGSAGLAVSGMPAVSGVSPHGDAAMSAAIGWLRRPDLVTVAAVTGRATGAGLDVAMACDFRIVAADAELAPSATNNGPGPGLGIDTVARLGEVLGYSRALEFLTTSRRLTGRQAAALGLANLAVDATELDAALEQLIQRLFTTPRSTVTAAKAVLATADGDHRRRADELAAGLRLAADET